MSMDYPALIFSYFHTMRLAGHLILDHDPIWAKGMRSVKKANQKEERLNLLTITGSLFTMVSDL